MRIRYSFLGAFVLLILFSSYMGLLPHSASSSVPVSLQPSDKFLHFITFFLLSVTFYWIPDTSRRRALQASLLVCTFGLGVGSEIVQALLPNDRLFDPFDIVANIVGSGGAIGLCGWYHRRMLERRRQARFGSLGENSIDAGSGIDDDDIELGLHAANHDDHSHDRNLGPQETGVVTNANTTNTTTTTTTTNLEQEVDNWDENAVDSWDTEDGPGPAEETIDGNVKMRND